MIIFEVRKSKLFFRNPISRLNQLVVAPDICSYYQFELGARLNIDSIIYRQTYAVK